MIPLVVQAISAEVSFLVCVNSSHMNTSNTALVSVKCRAVILDDQGRVLLCRLARSGFWCLPGGNLDPGETLEQCMIREIREELGVEAQLGGIIHNRSFLRGENSVIDVWFFIANSQDFQDLDLTKASHAFEHSEVGFFSPDELLGRGETVRPDHLQTLVDQWHQHGARFLS